MREKERRKIREGSEDKEKQRVEGREKEGRQNGERVTNERPSAKRELIQRTALPPSPSHDLHSPLDRCRYPVVSLVTRSQRYEEYVERERERGEGERKAARMSRERSKQRKKKK